MPARTWRDLGDITLSEISQSWKNKYYMIPFIEGSWGKSNSKRQKGDGGRQGPGGEWTVSVQGGQSVRFTR